jgi:hypothetical protein
MTQRTIYTLEHRGKKFRMHGITQVVIHHALSCNVCKKEFPLDEITATLNSFINARAPLCMCRDITCCVRPPAKTASLLRLGVDPGSSLRPAYEPQFDKPSAERAAPVCWWCKGAREITINFKTKPCDCVNQQDLDATVQTSAHGWTAANTYLHPQPVPTNGQLHI